MVNTGPESGELILEKTYRRRTLRTPCQSDAVYLSDASRHGVLEMTWVIIVPPRESDAQRLSLSGGKGFERPR